VTAERGSDIDRHSPQPRQDRAVADVRIRPLRPRDAAEAAAVARVALEAIYPDPQPPTPAEASERVVSGTARVAHLQRTDPGGCWVAEADGQIVGTALGLIREDVWGFSLFGVLPAFQGRGIGRRLYAAAVAYGEGEPGGIILSSVHPAAIRGYARTPGYRLVPAVSLSGVPDLSRAPVTLRCRPGDLATDAPTIDAASRHVRGASHLRDLPTMLDAPGRTLLVIDGEGFACVRPGSPALLAARTEAAAEDLRWGALRCCRPGKAVTVDFVTAQNQWAVRVGLEARLAIAPDGPMFVRGAVGPLAPYLPSGAYL
jgi:GNAT superfamily N-acetyltransferase